MKGVALTTLAFAVLMFVINVPMPLFHENKSAVLIASASIFACAVAGAAAWLLRGRVEAEDPDVERAVTDGSMASAAIGIAVALVALGLQFGVFLVAIGGGLFAFGVAGVVRERQTERRLR